MLTCKLKPHYTDCQGCLMNQVDFEAIADCESCAFYNMEYDILYCAKDYVLLMNHKGEPERVSYDRVYDVKEVEW